MLKKIILSAALMFITLISNAQTIPNGTFENWSNPNGYLDPNNWGTLNSITSSDYYLKLISQNIPGVGVSPGVAVCGTLNPTSIASSNGIPFAFRPTNFTGKWQYMGNSSSDVGTIKVYLTKWNTAMSMRDTVGYLVKNLTGMVMSWANFNLPITYLNGNTPDSCLIILNSSGSTPQAGSYLYVDNLAFTGITSGINEINKIGLIKILPNPSNDFIQIDFSELTKLPSKVFISDLTGKTLSTFNCTGNITQTFSIVDLANGTYLISIQTESGLITEKIIKQ
ncbi:MAG: hypothetical protein RLZZ546_1625 [Bacteroidota bacterium]